LGKKWKVSIIAYVGSFSCHGLGVRCIPEWAGDDLEKKQQSSEEIKREDPQKHKILETRKKRELRKKK